MDFLSGLAATWYTYSYFDDEEAGAAGLSAAWTEGAVTGDRDGEEKFRAEVSVVFLWLSVSWGISVGSGVVVRRSGDVFL